MLGLFMIRITFILTVVASIIVTFLAIENGCDWPGALIRGVGTAAGISILASFILGPLLNVLDQQAKQEKEKLEDTTQPEGTAS